MKQKVFDLAIDEIKNMVKNQDSQSAPITAALLLISKLLFDLKTSSELESTGESNESR